MALLLVAGCGNPLRDVPRLDEVAGETQGTAALSDAAVEDGAAATSERPGLFARLLNRRSDDPSNDTIDAAVADAQGQADTQEDADTSDQAQNSDAADPSAGTDAPRRGLFGLFRGGSRAAADAPAEDADDAPVAPRRGFFGRRFGGRATATGPDAQEVAAGTRLPFGQIARVCDVRRSQLGTAVDTAGGYTIYDTIPAATAARVHYVTGFDDGCARTFTGAVVISGDIETHEFVRYRPSNERIDFTSVDAAYEALKARVCRVAQGQPCGERSARLNRNTRFVTVYNFFGGTFSSVPTQWTQILLHDGEVLAVAMKEG